MSTGWALVVVAALAAGFCILLAIVLPQDPDEL